MQCPKCHKEIGCSCNLRSGMCQTCLRDKEREEQRLKQQNVPNQSTVIQQPNH